MIQNFFKRQALKVKYFTYKFLKAESIMKEYPWGDYIVGFDWIGQNIFFENFENEEVALLSQFITGRSVIIDAGANIGFHTVFFANLAKNGVVCSFEPSAKTYLFLQKNISANKLQNVKLFNSALGNRVGSETLYINNSNRGMNSLKFAYDQSNSETVSITTIDDLFSTTSLKSLDLIKIDVEGFELEVLKGAEQVLTNYKPVIFFESWKTYKKEFDVNSTEEIKYLANLGYDFYAHDSGKLYKVENNIDVLSKDLVAIPKGKQKS